MDFAFKIELKELKQIVNMCIITQDVEKLVRWMSG